MGTGSSVHTRRAVPPRYGASESRHSFCIVTTYSSSRARVARFRPRFSMPLSPVLMPIRKRPPEISLSVLLAPAVMVGCRDTGLVMKLPMLQ